MKTALALALASAAGIAVGGIESKRYTRKPSRQSI